MTVLVLNNMVRSKLFCTKKDETQLVQALRNQSLKMANAVYAHSSTFLFRKRAEHAIDILR